MHSAIRQRETLQAFHNRLYERGLVESSYSNSKWEIVAKIADLLEVYKKATTYLSGVYYPTSNLSPRDGQKPRASQPTRASQPMLLLAFSGFSFIHIQ